MSEIERTNLDAHVSICQLRYESLNQRLDAIGDRMEKLEEMICDIHTSLKSQNKGNTIEWIKARDGLIAVLLGSLAFMVSKFLF